MSNAKKKPIDDVKLGRIVAAIWKNETDDTVRYNVTFGRLYKQGDGKWRTSESFGRDDLLRLAKVADMAETRIFELQNSSAAEDE